MRKMNQYSLVHLLQQKNDVRES